MHDKMLLVLLCFVCYAMLFHKVFSWHVIGSIKKQLSLY